MNSIDLRSVTKARCKVLHIARFGDLFWDHDVGDLFGTSVYAALVTNRLPT